jgi:hypothetical protein
MRILEQMVKESNSTEYQELLQHRKQFSDTGVAHFVKNLRNFILHRDLPAISGQMSFAKGDDALRFDTLLPTHSLLLWKGWDKESKAFLAQHESISLSKTITEYGRLAAAFYNWVFKEILTVCFRNADRKVSLDLAVAALERNLKGQPDKSVTPRTGRALQCRNESEIT